MEEQPQQPQRNVPDGIEVVPTEKLRWILTLQVRPDNGKELLKPDTDGLNGSNLSFSGLSRKVTLICLALATVTGVALIVGLGVGLTQRERHQNVLQILTFKFSLPTLEGRMLLRSQLQQRIQLSRQLHSHLGVTLHRSQLPYLHTQPSQTAHTD
jgi:hypothetical protein